jgi:RNA polymerase sigma-32 factor
LFLAISGEEEGPSEQGDRAMSLEEKEKTQVPAGSALQDPTPEAEALEPEVLEPGQGAGEPGEDLGHGYFEEGDLGALPSTDLVESGPLQQYMAEVSRYPLIRQEEEVRLAKKYLEEADLRAAYTLVLANLRLVVKIAYEFRRSFSNLMDLIQEGNIGLMRAVEKFDPYRGVKLSSYAAWWIRAYIIRYILNNWSLVKVGTTQNQRRLFFNLKKAKRELEAQGFRPEPKLIAARLNVREDEVVEMEKRLAGSDISLDAPLDEDSDASRMDFVADTGDDVSERLADREFRALVRSKFLEFRAGLDEREQAIFDRRLLAEDPVTLRELGETFGVSRERVRQLETDVKRRLKEFLKSSQEVGDALRE